MGMGIMKALSIRQPWAHLIIHGKPIENRSWSTTYRGPLLLHAAKAMTILEWAEAEEFVRSTVRDPAAIEAFKGAWTAPRGATLCLFGGETLCREDFPKQ